MKAKKINQLKDMLAPKKGVTTLKIYRGESKEVVSCQETPNVLGKDVCINIKIVEDKEQV
jgi:hypothetical protein